MYQNGRAKDMTSKSLIDEISKEPKRRCRKCLLREMDEKEYFDNLYSYIAHLDEEIKVSDEKYEERLSICKECELLLDGMCRACGCYVELRAVMIKNECPYKHWLSES